MATCIDSAAFTPAEGPRRQGKAKRLLFVIGQLGYGGSEKQMVLLAGRLKADYEVEVLCTSTSLEPFGAALLQVGVPVHKPDADGRLARLVWLFSRLKVTRCDVLLLYSLRSELALLIAALNRAKIVVNERSGLPRSVPYRLASHLLFRKCSRIVVNSEATRRSLVSRYPFACGKVVTVFNGIEPSEGPGVEPPASGACIFSLVAGFRPWKGHAFLIDAVEELAKRGLDFSVLLVGDGPTRVEVEGDVARRGLERFVVFTGWQVDPALYLRRAHVNLNLSSHESLPNAVMEGMALGLPSIVTRVGGNPELVEDGVHGKVVDYGNIRQLADAMAFMIHNREIAMEYGHRARERMLTDFSVERMVERTRELIDEL